jgi:hypothetical protein
MFEYDHPQATLHIHPDSHVPSDRKYHTVAFMSRDEPLLTVLMLDPALDGPPYWYVALEFVARNQERRQPGR